MYHLYFWTIENELICVQTDDHPSYYGDTVLFNPMPNIISVFSHEYDGHQCIAGLWMYHRHDKEVYDKFIRNLPNIIEIRNARAQKLLSELIS